MWWSAGVAAHGFEDQLARHLGGVERFLDQEAMVVGGHAGDRVVHAAQALERHLQQALAVDQRRELLGEGLARQGPQTCAVTAAKNNWMNGSGHEQ
jgi:hypothetical protein